MPESSSTHALRTNLEKIYSIRKLREDFAGKSPLKRLQKGENCSNQSLKQRIAD